MPESFDRILRDNGCGSGPHHKVARVFRRHCRHADDHHVRIHPSNPGGRFNAIQPRHVDVHHHDSRLELCHGQHGLFTITRLADNFEMGIGGEDAPERLPHLLHVIDEEDADDLTAFAFHDLLHF